MWLCFLILLDKIYIKIEMCIVYKHPLVHVQQKREGVVLSIMLSNCFRDLTVFIDMFNPLKASRVSSHAWVARVLGHPLPPPISLPVPSRFLPLDTLCLVPATLTGTTVPIHHDTHA